MKSTNVAALAGRVIESVSIHHSDAEQPIGIEIRCVGGTYFAFEAIAVVAVKASSLLAVNRRGALQNERRRTFTSKGIWPVESDDREGEL